MPQENEKEAGVEEEKTTEEVKTGKTEVMMNILDLPPEIQRRILACLPNKTLSESVRRVCRAWDKEALSIIGDVYLRFCRRFNPANLAIYRGDDLKSVLDLEETLRQYFVPLMECGLPCLIPGQILDCIIRVHDRHHFATPRSLPRQMERITEAWGKGHFQCYFKRLMSLPLEAPLGRRDLPLPVPLHHSFPYNAPVEIARLRNEAHRYRRRAEEGKEREEALLRAIAQKAGNDEEWKRLLTQHQEALHLSRAQEAEEEGARLWDENQKALAHLQAEMTKERERFRDLNQWFKDELHHQVEHEKAILLMEVERFKTLVHQAELTPPHIQAEKKCDTLRDLVAEAERLPPLLRSQADKERSRLYSRAHWLKEEIRQGDPTDWLKRLRYKADLEWTLYQRRAEMVEEERERLRALLARQPEQGRLQDGGQEEALPHLPPLSTHTKDPIPH